MENKNLKWIDKDALVIMIISLMLLIGLPLSFLISSLAIRDIASVKFAMGILFFVILFILAMNSTLSHCFPLKMRNDTIFLASPSFPSFGRKQISLRDIKNIKYSCAEKWDERGDEASPRGDGIVGFIRVEDVHGNRYRNVFFKTKSNIDSFKQYINGLVKKGMIDKNWLANLSPMLKP